VEEKDREKDNNKLGEKKIINYEKIKARKWKYFGSTIV
jgi:hypothetical protein